MAAHGRPAFAKIDVEGFEAEVLAIGIDALPEPRAAFPDLAACVAWIRAAGGVPFLAHPRWSTLVSAEEMERAVGLAAAVQVPWTTPVAVGVPKTGFPTEIQAHVAAANISSQIAGLVPTREKPFAEIPALCVMDAGNNGIMLLGDHMLKPRRAAMLIPGPQNHAIKIGLEKYFLWKSRTGRVNLP